MSRNIKLASLLCLCYTMLLTLLNVYILIKSFILEITRVHNLELDSPGLSHSLHFQTLSKSLNCFITQSVICTLEKYSMEALWWGLNDYGQFWGQCLVYSEFYSSVSASSHASVGWDMPLQDSYNEHISLSKFYPQLPINNNYDCPHLPARGLISFINCIVRTLFSYFSGRHRNLPESQGGCQ